MNYLDLLAMDEVSHEINGSKLTVTTPKKNKDIFYVKILGQPLTENNISLKKLVVNSKYSDKWKSIDDKEIYGFESEIFVENSISYTYIPYEILINLNKQRVIKTK